MKLFRRGSSEPPNVSPYTAAGSAAHGDTNGSGSVAPWNQLQPYGGAGIVALMPGTVQQGGTPIVDLPPDSEYVSRELHGGVRAFPAFGEYQWSPPNTGGFTLMAHRPPLALIEGQQMQPQTFEADATWREAPSVVDLCRRTPSELTNG